jgi:hypothetical protein
VEGPTGRRAIGTLGMFMCSLFIDLSIVFYYFYDLSSFYFQLFFLLGEGLVILPRLLLLSFFYWLRERFTLMSCSAYTFFLLINY